MTKAKRYKIIFDKAVHGFNPGDAATLTNKECMGYIKKKEAHFVNSPKKKVSK